MGAECAELRHPLDVTYPVSNGIINSWEDHSEPEKQKRLSQDSLPESWRVQQTEGPPPPTQASTCARRRGGGRKAGDLEGPWKGGAPTAPLHATAMEPLGVLGRLVALATAEAEAEAEAEGRAPAGLASSILGLVLGRLAAPGDLAAACCTCRALRRVGAAHPAWLGFVDEAAQRGEYVPKAFQLLREAGLGHRAYRELVWDRHRCWIRREELLELPFFRRMKRAAGPEVSTDRLRRRRGDDHVMIRQRAHFRHAR